MTKLQFEDRLRKINFWQICRSVNFCNPRTYSDPIILIQLGFKEMILEFWSICIDSLYPRKMLHLQGEALAFYHEWIKVTFLLFRSGSKYNSTFSNRKRILNRLEKLRLHSKELSSSEMMKSFVIKVRVHRINCLCRTYWDGRLLRLELSWRH